MIFYNKDLARQVFVYISLEWRRGSSPAGNQRGKGAAHLLAGKSKLVGKYLFDQVGKEGINLAAGNL
jgi:hypothetical protein